MSWLAQDAAADWNVARPKESCVIEIVLLVFFLAWLKA